MSGKLFAFHLSRPLELPNEMMEGEYDPQTQTILWQGGTRAQAVYCTGGIGPYSAYAQEYCNAYGSYCNTWGNVCPQYGYACD